MAFRYKTIPTVKAKSGKNYRFNPIYPDIPLSENDIYVIASQGDRYDLLASRYYGDSTLWWIIATANTSGQGSLLPTPGDQIRIPYSKDEVISLYETLNSTR